MEGDPEYLVGGRVLLMHLCGIIPVNSGISVANATTRLCVVCVMC